jgi:hypothetical protein
MRRLVGPRGWARNIQCRNAGENGHGRDSYPNPRGQFGWQGWLDGYDDITADDLRGGTQFKNCVAAGPISRVEEIASAYLIEADGNSSVALRRAIGDALSDLSEMGDRARRAEGLISRGFVRTRLWATRIG